MKATKSAEGKSGLELNSAARALALGAVFAASLFPSASFAGAREQAIRLFDRLAGVPIALDDPRLAQMESLIKQGKLQEAAQVATNDDGFYNITIKHLSVPMTNVAEDVLAPFNDTSATMIGIVRDDLDARLFLTGDFIYKADASVTGTQGGIDIQTDRAIYGSNRHYDYLEARRINLRQKLIQAPQKIYITTNATTETPQVHPDAAGLLTTRQWGQAHLEGGTNRRPIQYAFMEFLCLPNTMMRDATMPDNRVRRDVDRAPGGSVPNYLNTCRSCHGGMDGLAGSYAFYENVISNGDDFTRYRAGTVANKMNQLATMYPAGFVTVDDSWVNNYVKNQNASIGWTGEMTGKGVKQLGIMLSNTQAFAGCMAKRAFTEVCRRKPGDSDANLLQSLSDDFQSSGFKFRRLMEKAAIAPACLGN